MYFPSGPGAASAFMVEHIPPRNTVRPLRHGPMKRHDVTHRRSGVPSALAPSLPPVQFANTGGLNRSSPRSFPGREQSGLGETLVPPVSPAQWAGFPSATRHFTRCGLMPSPYSASQAGSLASAGNSHAKRTSTGCGCPSPTPPCLPASLTPWSDPLTEEIKVHRGCNHRHSQWIR